MKLTVRIKDIFAHAVALTQSGRLRSTIFGIGPKIYILNQDFTVLIRFRLRKEDKIRFDQPISFTANDYDSDLVHVEGDRICFTQRASGFERVKQCRTPDLSPQEVERWFKRFRVTPHNTVSFHSQMLSLIDEDLPHIEFSCVDGEFKMIQRDIYSGNVRKITREASGGFGGTLQTDEVEDFEPVGMRTADFLALFTFQSALDFHFLADGVFCVDSRDNKMPMRALIGKCLYNELGRVE